MSDFGRNLASMIAQARPPQASPQRQPQVIPGPMGLSGKRQQAEGHMQIQLDPLMKFLGYKTPEERDQIYDRLRQQKDSMSPEEWDQARGTPQMQKTLGYLAKKSSNPVVQDDQGLWDIPRQTPEAMLRESGAPAIAAHAGAYGPEAREKLREPTPMEQAEHTEKMATINLTKLATEADIDYKNALIEQTRGGQQLDELVYKKQMAYIDLQMAQLEAQQQATLMGAARTMDAEAGKHVLALNKHFANVFKDLYTKDSLLQSSSPADKHKLLTRLASAVNFHSSGVLGIVNDPDLAEPAIRQYIGMADPEFYAEIKNNKLGKQVQGYLRDYVEQYRNMLQIAAPTSPDLFLRLAQWAVIAGYDYAYTESLLISTGLSPEDVDKVMSYVTQRPAEPRESEYEESPGGIEAFTAPLRGARKTAEEVVPEVGRAVGAEAKRKSDLLLRRGSQRAPRTE